MANEIFEEYKIHHIPVLVNRKVVGIVSLGDLLFKKKLESENQDKVPLFIQIGVQKIEDIMTHSPYVIDEAQALGVALDIMIERRINCLPVVNKEKELAGILTSFDLLNYLNKQLIEC